jgi:tRNA G10  N-methylase Trm11
MIKSIEKNIYTREEKKEIEKRYFRSISLQDARNDFFKLRKSYRELKPLSRIGNNVVDYFTRIERIDTKGNKGISFFDYEYNRELLLKTKKYLRNFIKKNQRKYGFDLSFRAAFDLYFGSIKIYKPLNAMNIYSMFQPTSILDFTCGWGGRLIGAAALNIPKYTGIDLNQDLKYPYKKMINFLKNKSNTEIKMIFEDALQVDYSKLDYDLVLTSPPYYNTELYNGTNRRTKEEWNEEFYKPLFKKTYKYLKIGGWYCLNIPNDVYEKTALPLLGKPTNVTPLIKKGRGKHKKYEEMIYCWYKKK